MGCLVLNPIGDKQYDSFILKKLNEQVVIFFINNIFSRKKST